MPAMLKTFVLGGALALASLCANASDRLAIDPAPRAPHSPVDRPVLFSEHAARHSAQCVHHDGGLRDQALRPLSWEARRHLIRQHDSGALVFTSDRLPGVQLVLRKAAGPGGSDWQIDALDAQHHRIWRWQHRWGITSSAAAAPALDEQAMVQAIFGSPARLADVWDWLLPTAPYPTQEPDRNLAVPFASRTYVRERVSYADWQLQETVQLSFPRQIAVRNLLLPRAAPVQVRLLAIDVANPHRQPGGWPLQD